MLAIVFKASDAIVAIGRAKMVMAVFFSAARSALTSVLMNKDSKPPNANNRLFVAHQSIFCPSQCDRRMGDQIFAQAQKLHAILALIGKGQQRKPGQYRQTIAVEIRSSKNALNVIVVRRRSKCRPNVPGGYH